LHARPDDRFPIEAVSGRIDPSTEPSLPSGYNADPELAVDQLAAVIVGEARRLEERARFV
jgi:hypothetical protein